MSTRPNRALVTGGNGFVGSHVVRRLVHEGWEVHAIVRPHSDLAPIAELRGRIVRHEYDGSTESLVRAVEAARPDVAFHLASLFLSEHRPEDVAPFVTANLLLGTQLMEAMSGGGVTRLVNTGTSWQHYESRDYAPVNLYAATKEAFEAIIAYYVEARGARVITLKLFDTYGPDDPRPKLFHLLAKVAREQQPLDMSPGEQLIDLVHVDDVVTAFLLAADRLLQDAVAGHERYAVSSGAPLALRKLVAIYERVSGVTLPIRWGGRPYRQREVMRPWDRGTRLPGWAPRIGLEEGIVQTLSFCEGSTS
jgi:nucleoside-diphosphate-sugar epimerase